MFSCIFSDYLFNQYVLFKILQNHFNIILTSRSNAKQHHTLIRIHGCYGNNAIVCLKNKFEKSDFSAINTKIFFYGVQSWWIRKKWNVKCKMTTFSTLRGNTKQHIDFSRLTFYFLLTYQSSIFGKPIKNLYIITISYTVSIKN